MYEVELKFSVADPRALEQRLGSLAAKWQEPIHQVDRYSNHPCRDFARTDEAEVPQARACLESLARELGCGNPERRSYLELLLESQTAR